jgi:triacylglycerol lipase
MQPRMGSGESTTSDARRLSLAFLPPPPVRTAFEWLSTLEQDRWPEPPQGDGRPVLLLPGFLAGDASLTRMARWLRTGGFELARSGISWNTNCMEPVVTSVVERVERAVERAGRPAMLVGQSRGGTIARAAAVRRPDLIDTIVTLGSPILDQLDVYRSVWLSIGAVGLLGTLGVPGMFSFSCLNGDCCQDAREDVSAPFPEDVRFISIYSRRDEVVRWRSCLDPAAVHVEVDSTHLGMGVDREVWQAMTLHSTAAP